MSDSDNSDSDSGIRYKTQSVRNAEDIDVIKLNHKNKYSRHKEENIQDDSGNTHESTYLRKNNDSSSSHLISEDSNESIEPNICGPIPQLYKDKCSSDDSNESKIDLKICGPVLPPHLKNDKNRSDDSNDYFGPKISGPTLPLHLKKDKYSSDDSYESFGPKICGPASSPNLGKEKNTCSHLTSETNSDDSNGSIESKICGPALPPHLKKDKNSLDDSDKYIEPKICGPVLPLHLRKDSSDDINKSIKPIIKTKESKKVDTKIYGPIIPSHLRNNIEINVSSNKTASNTHKSEESDSDDDMIGPLPATIQKKSKSTIELEERALEIKLNKMNPKPIETVREEWMLELPDVKAPSLGLGSRQFKNKEGPDFSDRTSWTDTPKSKIKKEKKIDLKEETKLEHMRKRDLEQEAMIKKYKKHKNNDSLLDLHQKKLSEQKKKSEEKPERTPFNRDTDLKVNRFDEAQKKSIIKKAMHLDDRFSSGQSKFL